MKKFALITLLIGSALFIHLLLDDELEPMAQHWIDALSKEPSLHNNGYIELMALGMKGDTSHQRTKSAYLDASNDSQKGIINHEKVLHYPKLDRLVKVSNDLNLCTLDTDGCIETIIADRKKIEDVLSPYLPLFIKLRGIGELSNFQSLNAIVTELDFKSMNALFQLASIEVLLLIDAGKLKQAEGHLAKLIRVERQFLASANEATFDVLPLIHFKAFYTPLIQRLVELGYDGWQHLSKVITPLTFDEIAMNKIWLQLFVGAANVLKAKQGSEVSNSDTNIFEQGWMRISFKENMTINQMFALTQMKLLPEGTTKKNMLEELKVRAQLAENTNTERLDAMKNTVRYSIRNYRNVVGSLLVTTAVPKLLDLHEDKLELDLQLLLLNALIESSDGQLKNVVKKFSYQNPYTGEMPTLRNGDICYELRDLVCMKIPVK